MANPQFMDMIVNSNPMVSQMMASNPQMKSIMINPEMLKMAMSPENIAMTQNLMGQEGYPGLVNFSQGLPPQLNPQSNQLNDLIGMAQQFSQPSSLPLQPALPSNTDYKALYSAQLVQMKDMGLANEEINIAALKQTQGNVSAAIDIVFKS
jgi:ubiquilin